MPMTTRDTHTPIRIVIADDHPLVRDGLRKLFEHQPGFAVVGEAADGADAVRQAKALEPDVLLLDLAMPALNGLEVLRELGAQADRVKTVLLTASIEREEVVDALRLGARGVVLKESATHVLYDCIRAVMSGQAWVGRESIDDLLRSLRQAERDAAQEARPAARLTKREIEVIAAVVDGGGNKDIGRTFGLSEQTVKNHLSHIYDKLGVSNRLELALYAVHHKLLSGGPGGRGPAPKPAGPRRQPPRPARGTD